MKGFLSKISVFMLAFILLFSSVSISTVFAEESDVLDLDGESAIMVDATSGKILYSKNSDELLPIASMTKMMTEYLVHEAVDNGKIEWTQLVTTSEYAHKISQDTNLSNVPLELGAQYTVKELYEAMAIYSANGATIALAELIAGSESNFVKMMNEKGEELELGEFKFVNSTGLNNSDLLGNYPDGTSESDENMMSANATATLAYYLIKDYPEVLETASIPKLVFQEGQKYSTQMDNWNWMLPGLVYGYEGVDGLKTGSTPTAGYSFTATAKRGDMRLITVVMKTDSYQKRFSETKKMLDYGFSQFKLLEVATEGDTIEGYETVNVEKGKEKETALVVEKTVKEIVSSNQDEQVEYDAHYNKKVVNEDNELLAPAKKGTKVATLLTKDSNSSLGYLNETIEKANAVTLVTKEEMKKANWLVLSFRAVGNFFGNVWDKTTDTVKGWF